MPDETIINEGVATVTEHLMQAFIGLQAVFTKEWISWPESSVLNLRTVIAQLNDLSLEVRSAFDSEINDQNDAGKFNNVQPIRKRRAEDSEKPGRKAVAPTMADRFAKFGKR